MKVIKRANLILKIPEKGRHHVRNKVLLVGYSSQVKVLLPPLDHVVSLGAVE